MEIKDEIMEVGFVSIIRYLILLPEGKDRNNLQNFLYIAYRTCKIW